MKHKTFRQPEDALDAFNDETFGGGGLGEEWREDAHEELAGERIFWSANFFSTKFPFSSYGAGEIGAEAKQRLLQLRL